MSVIGAFAGACALVIVFVQLRAIPLVGELAEVVPAVAVRLKLDTTYFAPPNPESPQTDEPTEPTNPRTPEPANPRTDELANRRTHEPTNPRTDEPPNRRTHEPTEPDEPTEPTEPDLSLSRRSFDGRYVVAELPAAAPEDRAPWQLAGAVGTEIGASARKTSVGIAKAFTRAGVSLARTF